MYDCCGFGPHTYGVHCNATRKSDEALADLKRKLTDSKPEGVGNVTFYRDGDRTSLTLEDVLVDTISASAANKGVIAVEFPDSDRVAHVPFVSYWTISY